MKRPLPTRRNRSLVALAGMFLLALLLRLEGFDEFPLAPLSSPESTPTRPSEHESPREPESPGRVGRDAFEAEDSARTGTRDSAARRLARAFAERESGFMVTFDAEVSKILADDHEGSRHQRFLVRLDGADQTLLVAHNIDLAERVPVAPGDRVRLRGQYEWNDRGGVLHWTHHDPDGRHPGGFIEADGRRYE